MTKSVWPTICLFSLCLLFAVNLAWAGSSDRYGLDTAGRTAGSLPAGQGGTASQSLAIEIGRIAGAALAFLGTIFLVLMIAGGIMWMTAGGSEERVKTAGKLIIAAIIGLIIVLGAYAITTFVAENVLAK